MHGLLILICCFSFYVSSVISFVTGIDNSVVFRFFCVFSIVYSSTLFILTFSDNAPSRSKSIYWISQFVVLAIMLLFFLTVFKYGYMHNRVEAAMLSFCCKGLVTPFMALAWAKRDYMSSVIRWIVPFVLFITFSQYVAVVKNGSNSFFYLDIGRQTLSYTSAFSIGLLVYFINEWKKKNALLLNKLFFTLALLLLPMNIYIVLYGGGKGAFILVFIIFFIVFYKKFGMASILLIPVLLLTPIIFADEIKLISSGGGNRILQLFISNDASEITSGRNYVYNEAVRVILDNLFIGKGAGSVVYETGYYAHNMFLDILIDWGWIGLLFVLLIFAVVVRRFWIYKNDSKMCFLFLLFIMSFVFLMFSSCFYVDYNIWFSTIAILGYEREPNKGVS